MKSSLVKNNWCTHLNTHSQPIFNSTPTPPPLPAHLSTLSSSLNLPPSKPVFSPPSSLSPLSAHLSTFLPLSPFSQSLHPPPSLPTQPISLSPSISPLSARFFLLSTTSPNPPLHPSTSSAFFLTISLPIDWWLLVTVAMVNPFGHTQCSCTYLQQSRWCRHGASVVSNAVDKLQFHVIMHLPCYHHCTTTCATHTTFNTKSSQPVCYTHDIQHKGHPTCATRMTFNTKSSQPVLHAPHSTQRPSNLYYTHDIQHKVLSTCATHTTFNGNFSQPVLHASYSVQTFPNQCCTHDIQCKVLLLTCVTCTTFSAKSIQSKWSAVPCLCQFNSFARLGMNQPPNLFKICWQGNGRYVHCTEWQDYHSAHRTTQVDLTLQETLCWMRDH